MHEYAAKFADALEQLAGWVRVMTVDRIARYIKLTGLGILALALALTSVIFLVWTIFGALEIPLTTAGAFAVFGVVFVVGGGILWFTRSRNDT
ncbi:MAG TPA: hypothetical protein VE569_01145 [Acidimicrobiia bacterium]|jgi:uncharacterized membrane protein|nr:hypothetical protein [Acidimicrobiia bacterium]